MTQITITEGTKVSASRKGLSQITMPDGLVLNLNTAFGTPLMKLYEYDEASIKEFNGVRYAYAKPSYTTSAKTWHDFAL